MENVKVKQWSKKNLLNQKCFKINFSLSKFIANSLDGVCLNSTDCTSENCVNGKCQGKNFFLNLFSYLKRIRKKSNDCFLSNKANGFNGVCLTLTDCSSKNCLNGKCQGKKLIFV